SEALGGVRGRRHHVRRAARRRGRREQLTRAGRGLRARRPDLDHGRRARGPRARPQAGRADYPGGRQLMSSHREAPAISQDPVADNTDTYAFVSPDDPDTVTIISNYLPLDAPFGGPNFFEFGDDVRYEIHIDN